MEEPNRYRHHRRHHPVHHDRNRAVRLRFTFTTADKIQFTGDHLHMQENLVAGQSVSVIGSPVISDGVTPSQATLSNVQYTSSDSTVFTVAADPNTPNGAIITSVGAGTESGCAFVARDELTGGTGRSNDGIHPADQY